MKIYILYQLRKDAWGGGNQFLKALKKEFENQGVYTDDPAEGETILFNSHQQLKEVLKLKSKYPQKVLIHRLGPIFHYHRGRSWKKYDRALAKITNSISEGVIFQSKWALNEAIKLGFDKKIPHQVIYNAVDKTIFNQEDKQAFREEKVKLIATSFSANWKKGFEIYQHLDNNLDFSKYQMTFVGNSPIEFKNIKYVGPVSSREIAEILKQHDIFITASEKDACSNSLIEALSCSLPAVALNDGGNPELVEKGGELFGGKEDILSKIEKVARNYRYYQSQIPGFSVEEAAQRYYQFAERIYGDIKKGKSRTKKVSLLTKINFYKMKFMLLK